MLFIIDTVFMIAEVLTSTCPILGKTRHKINPSCLSKFDFVRVWFFNPM